MFYFCLQMNKCLSDNQKAWRDRVSELEKKIDVTIQQKEQVCPPHFSFQCDQVSHRCLDVVYFTCRR